MKKTISFLMAFCMLFLSSCGLRGGEVTEQGFIDPQSGKEYLLCNVMTLRANKSEEEFIKVGDETFFTVAFESSSRFLCVEDAGEYLVYRASDVPEPTIESFDAIAAGIYKNNTLLVDDFYADDNYLPEELHGINPSQDTRLCKLMTEALVNGENRQVDGALISDEYMYFIRLKSQNYPGLHYLIVAFGDNAGNYYLRDRGTGKTVVCPPDVQTRLILRQ